MIEKRYNEWLNSEFLSKEDKEILKKMTKEEIEESFYKNLEFGTAGIRGIMGLGTSKINKYTIGKVTLGLARYINKNFKNGSVVVAYDTRNNSKEYALNTCLILNNEGIKTYFFDEYTSTPELAYSIKYLKCTNGIVITSSHNAKIYNGYKVYNSLGSQIIYPEDELIINEINNITDYNLVKMAKKNNELFNIVPEKEKEMFLKENQKALINENLLKEYAKDIKITYSSLHGVGLKPMKKLFDFYNINYNVVEKQSTYDGNFPYAPEPNPEYTFNYDLAVEKAKKYNSDLIIMSDPDADRVGAMYKDKNEYIFLNGNTIGTLFAYYIVTNKNNLNKNNYLVRSLPSSNMIDEIAKKYNLKLIEVLTGCKNIAYEKEKDEENYIFGYEESLGYVFDIDINDKNAFSSTLVLIEILCFCKSKNITFKDYINLMYKEIGYYESYSTSKEFKGIKAKEDMDNLMDDLRKDKIKIDYKEKIDYLLKNDRLKTNAIKYIFDNNSYLIVRPSGTEPKIKLYMGANSKNKVSASDALENLKKIVKNIFTL